VSKIQDAIGKLGRKPSPTGEDTNDRATWQSQHVKHGLSKKQPSRRQKVKVVGDKYHVNRDELIQAGLLAPEEFGNGFADEFRRIKRPLIEVATGQLAKTGEHMNVIILTSAMPGAGKTFCSLNIAVSIALEREINVVLVDADVAKPHITRQLGLEKRVGLIDLLLDDELDISHGLVRTDLSDIAILPAGQRHPQATELLASDRMSDIVHELATRYPDRIIVMDSPPLLLTSESHVLAKRAGQIAIVVEAGATSHQTLSQAIELLDPDAAVTAILNKSRHLLKTVAYGEGYGNYGYYGYE
jgi:exopolysaccharide/PEP-CTERM locus tyrosine autokinase